MRNLKQLFFKFPEFYFVILALLSGYNPPFYVNPIAIALIVILFLQLIFKDPIKLLLFGLAIIISNFVFCGLMIHKYKRSGEIAKPQPEAN